MPAAAVDVGDDDEVAHAGVLDAAMAADEELVAADEEGARAGGNDLGAAGQMACAAGDAVLEGAEPGEGEEPEIGAPMG